MMRPCGAAATPFYMAARLEFYGAYSLFHRDNVTLAETLGQAAKAAGVRRFVYRSAAVVVVGSRSMQPFAEAAVPGENPAGAYGRTKLLAERAVLAAQSPEIRTIALRPPFVWGRDAPAFDSIARATGKGQFLWINGGRYSVATIHVENLAAAIDAALQAPEAQGAILSPTGTPRDGRHAGTVSEKSRLASYYVNDCQNIGDADRCGMSVWR